MLRSVDGWDNEHFAFVSAESPLAAAASAIAVDNGPDGPTATIPDAHLLFTAQFSRAGADLVLQGEDGKTIAVHDYFATDARARLLSPEGAALSPDVVAALAGPLAPGQFAQAGAPQANVQAVGRVAQVEGGATIIRNGVAMQANTGDAILKGDVLQTVTGSLGVTFNDGSTLNLTANSRLVVNEFVYDPKGSQNSQLLDLVQGSLTFISGEVAHSGDMKIGTPVATMGIRGTVGGVTTADDGTVRFYVSQSATGAVILDSRGTIIANVVQDGPLIVVRPVGPLQVLAEELQKSPAQLAIELAALQHIVSIKSVGDQIIQQFFQQDPTNQPNPQSTDHPHTQIPNIQIDLKPDPLASDDGNAPPVTAIITIPPTPPTPGTPTPPDPDPIIVPIPVNLPPINFGPLNAATNEDQTLTFTGQTALSVFDADTGILTVTLSATHGVLTLAGGAAGLTFATGDGTADAAMTFVGTQAAINAALNGATFKPAQDYNGPAAVTVTVSDGVSPGISRTIAITVAAIDDAPVIGGTSVITGSVTETGDLPQIDEAGLGGGLEPEAALSAQIAGNSTVMAALTGLLTVPGGLATALATVCDQLNLDTATAMTVVWDFLDDRYVSHGPNEIQINEAFVRLGVEYAAYLKAGGAPLVDVTAKYTADGADQGMLPDRQQSLHDNLLGNLGAGPLQGRFDNNLRVDLTALITAVDPALLMRPFYSGNETATAAAAAVQVWDVANGYVPTATGMLVATDVDSNVPLTWSVNTTAGTYGTFALNASTGVWTYKLDNNLPATQQLAQSETATETFTATVTGEHGLTDTVNVTITVNGSNDAPVIVGSVAVDLPRINEAGPDGGLEPEAALSAQITPAVTAALDGLLDDPADVMEVLEIVRDELNLDTATAMTVVWDFLDDRYVSPGLYEIEINEAFVRLGIEYAKYLKNGGAPLVDVTAKYTADGNANTVPDRMQSLHDNLLGNLGAGPLQGRFGSNAALLDELTDLITGVDPDLLTRPFYSGNETASPAAVQAWDLANGYTPAATGMLVATDVDNNATLTWSVDETAGTYGTFALDSVSGVWTYRLDNNLAATQQLAQGETATETFTATVTDEHGLTDTMVVTVTATGTNDAPVIVGSVAVDLPQIEGAGAGVGLEPETGLNAQIAGNAAVQGALSGLLTVPAGVITVALATVRSELNVDTATAIAVVWDFLDDRYVSPGLYEIEINEAFVRLGVEYAKYLKAGGAPLVDVTAKYTADGNANTVPDRMQSLHDNLLGNLGSGPLQGRFGTSTNPALLDELTDLITGVDPDLLTRPFYSGNETASPAAVRAWDVANGFAPAVFTENGAPAVVNAALTLSDVDSATLVGATVTISANFEAGDDFLTFIDQNGITGSYANGVLTLTGPASVEDFQAALRSVTYRNTSEDPSGQTRTIAFQVNDGASQHSASNVAAVTVHVTSVNDAPELTMPQWPSAAPAVATALTGMSIADVDAETGVIAVSLSVNHGILSLSGSGLAIAGNGTGSLSVTGTLADINAALASDLFYTSPEGFENDAASLTVTVNDQGLSGSGGALADNESINITVNNIAPTLDDAALTAIGENTPASSIAGDSIASIFAGKFHDSPGASLAGIAIKGHSANAQTEGEWQYSTNGGANWYDIPGSAGTNHTIAMSSATLLRFLPVAGFHGTPGALSVYGLDNTYDSGFTNGTTLKYYNIGSGTGWIYPTSEHPVDVTVTVDIDTTLNLTATAWASSATIDLGAGTNVLNVLAANDISSAGIPTLTNIHTGNLVGTSGDDSIKLTGVQLDQIIIGNGTIDLGASSNDTISLTSTSADLNTLGATDASISGVETVSAAFAAAGVTIDLHGQSENFTIVGSNHADTLTGGAGNDTLTGGSGTDTFVFAANFGNDTITDFATGVDFLQFDQALFADVAAVLAATTDDSGHAVITYDPDNTITLNIDTTTLAAHQNHILIA